MKKSELIRLILIPVAFVAIVFFALVVPTGTHYQSADDILSVSLADADGRSATLADAAGIQAFVDWLELTVPADEICFVRETDAYTLDGADFTMVADQKPDQMKGLEGDESFTYSIYHMYVYGKGDLLYYNGVEYDCPAEARAALDTLFAGGGEDGK